jgi:hypothetical protein
MAKHSSNTQEDILNAFAMDYEPGAGLLEQYLLQYPEYALQLVDLSRELSRELEDDGPLSADDLAAVNEGMRRIQEGLITLQSLQAAPAKLFTDAVKVLGFPIQAGLAVREHRIEVSTIPSRILEKLALALRAPVSVLSAYMALPPQASQLRASKSSTKPAAAEKVSLERILKEAGYDEDALSKLFSGQ